MDLETIIVEQCKTIQRLNSLIENLANKLVALEDENEILRKKLELQNSIICETLNRREKENQDWKVRIVKEKPKPFTGNVND